MLDNSVLKFCEHKKFNNQHNTVIHQIHTQDNIIQPTQIQLCIKSIHRITSPATHEISMNHVALTCHY